MYLVLPRMVNYRHIDDALFEFSKISHLSRFEIGKTSATVFAIMLFVCATVREQSSNSAPSPAGRESRVISEVTITRKGEAVQGVSLSVRSGPGEKKTV